ncbi:class II aldolase/adducin family protein [Paraburkholderia caribensis]|uniref:class II aldolase/adducin family protein n=1 Tax=Paraburkholderia caribensis TaxID=75105 RepID=UPI001CAD0E2D|nr:class II aldolase/adducin family protein [Paraburkholderia caribensis]CAG9263115.1 Putative aldolase class 2 protein CC_1201 [Paraburkholderia caribensis]
MQNPVRLPETGHGNFSEAEWNARVDLAATYRLVAHYGWANLIYNHIALRVPGEPDAFLLKRHSVMFDEVTASNLIKISLSGKPLDEEGDDVNAAGFTIHTAILAARRDINCTVHIHSEAGMAMSAHGGGLLSITQAAMRFHNRLSYHDYEGISTDLSESERLQRDLGTHNKAMILRNHGLLTCGATASEALSLMRYLVISCETQLRLEATGAPIVNPPEDVCERTAKQWERHVEHAGLEDWPAYLRVADRIDPGFRS